MTTIRICDVNAEQIEGPFATMVLPLEWWLALGLEPQADPIDVCSPGCLRDMADTLEEDRGEPETDGDETVSPPRIPQTEPLALPEPQFLGEVTERG